jgi:uncharacterized protein
VTIARSTPLVLTRREILISLGALTIGFAGRTALGASNPASPAWPVWSVEGYGGKAYLVGETLPRPTDWCDGRIEALVPGCGMLWTETNQIFRGDRKELLTRNGIDTATPLLAGLSTEDRLRLEKAATLCKVPLASMTNFKPWLAGATLEEAFFEVMGLSGRAPDRVLSAEAKTAGIPLFSEFEVKDDVVTWFGTMSPQQDLQFLRYILDEVLASRSDQAATFTDWGRGDFRRATGVVTRIKQIYPELYGMLVLDRNRRWVPRFTKMLSEQKPAMVVLGHLHLVGSEGVLAQLAAAGMTVQKI